MPVAYAKFIIVFSFLFSLLTGCSAIENGNVNSANEANTNQSANKNTAVNALDDVEELGKIIKLPFAPSEATYSEITTGTDEPNKKRLVAILKFSVSDAEQIVANAQPYKTPAPADIDAEDWFPPELIAKSQEAGDGSLKGIEYAAADFLQLPYSNGRLTRINNTDYFVLEVFSS